MGSGFSLLYSQKSASGSFCEPVESSLLPHDLPCRFILIVSNLRSGIPRDILFSGFPSQISHAFIFSMHATWLTHINVWRHTHCHTALTEAESIVNIE